MSKKWCWALLPIGVLAIGAAVTTTGVQISKKAINSGNGSGHNGNHQPQPDLPKATSVKAIWESENLWGFDLSVIKESQLEFDPGFPEPEDKWGTDASKSWHYSQDMNDHDGYYNTAQSDQSFSIDVSWRNYSNGGDSGSFSRDRNIPLNNRGRALHVYMRFYKSKNEDIIHVRFKKGSKPYKRLHWDIELELPYETASSETGYALKHIDYDFYA